MADTAAGATTDPAHDDPSRRDFIHIAAAAAALGGVGAAAWPLIDQMNPSSDVRALSTIDVDLARVPVGQQIVVKWPGSTQARATARFLHPTREPLRLRKS